MNGYTIVIIIDNINWLNKNESIKRKTDEFLLRKKERKKERKKKEYEYESEKKRSAQLLKVKRESKNLKGEILKSFSLSLFHSPKHSSSSYFN